MIFSSSLYSTAISDWISINLNTSSKYKNNVNGFDQNKNKYAENSTYNGTAVANALEKARMKSRKTAAREAIKTGLNSVAPGAGTIANQVLKTEKGLMEILDKKDWSRAHHYLIYLGRSFCKAGKPNCQNCPISAECRKKIKR